MLEKLRLFSLAILSVFSFKMAAQVGIGTTTPNTSAMLDITSTNKGLLIPRVALSNISNTTSPINNPVEGLMVWNTSNGTVGGTGKGFYYFNGSVWIPVNINTSNSLDQAYDFGGPGVGRRIIADANPVHIGGEDGFVVSGTLGLGSTLDPTYGLLYNSRMFFYPKKAAFRAGYDSFTELDPNVINEGAWDTDGEIGLYSFATGRYNRASGEASFAANNDNHASGQYATAFGSQNVASGKSSTTFGTYNTSSGENTIAGGNSTIAEANNSFAFGTGITTKAYSETSIGSYNNYNYDDLHIADPSAFNSNDRAFSIGIGTGEGNRKNAFEVFKNGKTRINQAYYLPTTDGTANQVMATDGAGNVSWVSPQNNKNITSNTLYSNNTALFFNNGALADLANVQTAIFPGAIAPVDGNIQVKLYVLCTTTNIPTGFSIIATDELGTDTVIPLTPATPTTVSIGTNVSYSTDWSNWNADETKVYKLRIQGQGANISVGNIYLLTRAQ